MTEKNNFNVKVIREEASKLEKQYGFPQGLLLGLIEQESSFNPNAKSKAGALGLTQVMPFHLKSRGIKPEDFRNNPIQQLQVGAEILGAELKTFNNDPKLALIAYNAGAGNARKYLATGKLPNETRDYVPKVLSRAAKYGASIPQGYLDIVQKDLGSNVHNIKNLSGNKLIPDEQLSNIFQTTQQQPIEQQPIEQPIEQPQQEALSLGSNDVQQPIPVPKETAMPDELAKAFGIPTDSVFDNKIIDNAIDDIWDKA